MSINLLDIVLGGRHGKLMMMEGGHPVSPESHSECVPMQLFKEIIWEIDERLKQLTDIPQPQQLQHTESERNLRHSPVKAKEELTRLNIFEKKQITQQELINRIVKDNETFRRDIELKVDEQLKSFSWSLEKFNKQCKELIVKIDTVADNHKDIVQHILRVKEELKIIQHRQHVNDELVQQISEKFDIQKIQLNFKQQNTALEQHNSSIEQHQAFILQIENDLLTILNMYKQLIK